MFFSIMISSYLNFNKLYFISKLKETLNHVGKTLWMYLVSPQFFFFQFDPLDTKKIPCNENIMIFFLGTHLSFKRILCDINVFFLHFI